MSILPNDPVPLYDFNPGTKTWKIHAHKISSITNGNLVLQAAGENSEIYFAQKNNEVYKISDLLASGSVNHVTVSDNPGPISIGQYAMSSNAGTTGNIAIGHYASFTNSHNSGTYRIAIGYYAGYSQQNRYSVAIGYNSGYNNQGAYCVSIGYKAGETNQASNSTVLNSTGNALEAANTGFFVKPIRNVASTTGDKLCYDSGTGEISYQPDSGGGGGGGGGISCYFSGRPSDNTNTELTDTGLFTQFTALTAFPGGNSASGVSWSSGSVTLSNAGVYMVHYGLNVNSSYCRLRLCVSQLRNGSTVLANSYFSDEESNTDAEPLLFHPSRGSWMGSLSANAQLSLFYKIKVTNQDGNTRILEFSTSTYGEYGGTYLYGFKIA